MRKIHLLEILLICILGFSGWYLFNTMEHMKLKSPELRAIENYYRLVFSHGTGIDVMGNKIDSILAHETKGGERSVVAFLLRNKTLDADLQFWNEVNRHLSELDTVRLTAYCENYRCVEVIRKNPEMAHFPVIEYGLVGDMQALIGADDDGEFWFRGNRFEKINWRDGSRMPIDIAMHIGLRL